MSIKSVEQLNKVLEKLSTNQDWAAVSSEVKQKLINEYHEDFADQMLSDACKELNPKKSRRSNKDKKGADSTGNNDGNHSS